MQGREAPKSENKQRCSGVCSWTNDCWVRWSEKQQRRRKQRLTSETWLVDQNWQLKMSDSYFSDGFCSFSGEDMSRIHIYEPKQLGKHRLTEVGFDRRTVKYLWRDVIHEISSENEYLWGSKGAPSEGPSGEDDCSDTQWGFCGPNAPLKMKG